MHFYRHPHFICLQSLWSTISSLATMCLSHTTVTRVFSVQRHVSLLYWKVQSAFECEYECEWLSSWVLWWTGDLSSLMGETVLLPKKVLQKKSGLICSAKQRGLSQRTSFFSQAYTVRSTICWTKIHICSFCESKVKQQKLNCRLLALI